MFTISFADEWDKYFLKLDSFTQQILLKKIDRLETLETARHLRHGVPLFVVEAGQYRICFDEKEKTRLILFAGNHKQYEKWISEGSWKKNPL